MHLLMETAMGDSQQYGVLAPEEAEDLKRELPRLESQLEATRRQLAIDSKVRDAAASVNKLDRGSRSGRGSQAGQRNDQELNAAQQKCESLAQELWNFEKREHEVRRKLLEHTAGILQLTHKGYLQKDPPPQQNGIDHYDDKYGLDLFGAGDDLSFYRALDSAIDVGSGGGSAAFTRQTEAIQQTEQRLLELNQNLRDAIDQATSGRSNMPEPPQPSTDQNDVEESLQQQVSYLEGGLAQMQRSHAEGLQSFKSSQQTSEQRLEDLNTQLRSIVLRSSLDANPEFPLTPGLSGHGPEEQLSFLEQGLDALEQGVFHLKENHQTLSSRSGDSQEKADRYENIMQTLWPSISDGERFSEEAFSFKVSSLSNKVSDLSNQKDILKRQIEQQREINSKSDGERDAKLAALTTENEEAKRAADEARADAGKIKEEMQDVEGELVRLQTELTVARAELDGAYGTRAQRAAEVAQHPALLQEIADLKQELGGAQMKASETEQYQQQAQTLKKELSETISDYESMTKASIEFERERETLENTADSLRDRCEALETQINDERVSKLGKSPGTPGDRGSGEKGATSTAVLKNEFKKMMRETRTENMQALRVSDHNSDIYPTNNYSRMNERNDAN